MAECVECSVLERQCGSIGHNDLALSGKIVSDGSLVRDTKGRVRDVHEHDVATRELCKIESWPSRPGARLEQLHSRAELEQQRNLLRVPPRRPAGAPIVAAANAALQVAHSAGAPELG